MRSRTAEYWYNNNSSFKAKSAGIHTHAMVPISKELITWADYIFVMEKEIGNFIKEQFSELIEHREFVILNIGDFYYYQQSELIDKIRNKVDPILFTLQP